MLRFVKSQMLIGTVVSSPLRLRSMSVLNQLAAPKKIAIEDAEAY